MSVSDDEDSCSLPDDEVTEIKRAMVSRNDLVDLMLVN